MLPYVIFQLGSAVARASGFPSGLIAVPLVVVVLAALATVILKWLVPQPWANFDTSEFRTGRRVVPMSELDWAKVEYLPARSNRTNGMLLRFGSPRLRAVFSLRSARGQTIDEDLARHLAEVIERSSIEVPKSSYDPTGKFARYNFPGSVGKADAITLLLNPEEIDRMFLVLLR
ncbi:hypothetical protein ACFSBZ_01935 [Amnibacterium flavum]|nr:hypothetical protein [Amnibacterium flavum]